MALASDIALLRSVPLFEAMSEEQLRLFAFGARKRVFREGETLHEHGRPAEGGLIVMMGTIGLTDAEGRTREAEPGELIDELAMIARRSHRETAVAIEDGAVMAIERPLFLRMAEEYPDIVDLVRTRVGERLEALLARVEPVAARLAAIEDKA